MKAQKIPVAAVAAALLAAEAAKAVETPAPQEAPAIEREGGKVAPEAPKAPETPAGTAKAVPTPDEVKAAKAVIKLARAANPKPAKPLVSLEYSEAPVASPATRQSFSAVVVDGAVYDRPVNGEGTTEEKLARKAAIRAALEAKLPAVREGALKALASAKRISHVPRFDRKGTHLGSRIVTSLAGWK